MEAALCYLRAGQPVPPFTNLMAEANFWVDMASRAELKAYALACFTRMPQNDQRSFLTYLHRQVA